MKLKLIVLLAITGFIVLNFGCVMNEKSSSSSVKEIELSIDELNKIDDLIHGFVVSIYSTDAKENYTKTVNGIFDDEFKEILSKTTLKESEKNSEIPVHYPRFVEANGLTLINYEISKSNDKEEIVINKIDNIDEGYLYYVKVNLIADAVSENTFKKNYKRNENTGEYTESPGDGKIESEDKIKIQAKYDLKIVKEKNKYKIDTFTEVDTKPQTKNRLLITNNDYIERIPFLNIKASENGEIKEDKNDVKLYETDSKVVEEYFTKIQDLDSVRMSLLKTEWEKGKDDFSNFLEHIDINNGKEIDLGDEDKYKENFPYDSFPLRFGMEEIKTIDKNKVEVYLGYSENNHIYSFGFTASVEEDDGLNSNPNDYYYEYLIWINDENMITKMKLNDIYKVISEE